MPLFHRVARGTLLAVMLAAAALAAWELVDTAPVWTALFLRWAT
jgi:hypothetical protein